MELLRQSHQKDLFKSEVDETKPNAGNDIVKPADKTVAASPRQTQTLRKESDRR